MINAKERIAGRIDRKSVDLADPFHQPNLPSIGDNPLNAFSWPSQRHETQTTEHATPDDVAITNAAKVTHKDKSGRPLKDQTLRRYIKQYDLVPNVLEEGRWVPEEQRINALWNHERGGTLYARVPDNETYEDTVKVTVPVNGNGKKHTEHFVPVRFIKGNEWKFPLGRELTKNDIVPIHNTEKKISPSEYHPSAGAELELLVRGGLDISEPINKALQKEGAGTSVEYLKNTIEVNFAHSNNPTELAKSDLRLLKLFDREAGQQGKYLLPLAMWPYKLTPNDATDHPYVKGIVERMGKANIEIFGGSESYQVMMENHSLERGREALTFWSQITPLLKALSHSSTVAYGRVNPNMKEIILQKEREGARVPVDRRFLENVDYDTPLSTRQAARTFGSPLAGGVPTEQFPVDRHDFYRSAEQIVTEQKSPTIDRVGGIGRKGKGKEGHHLDFRYRRTIGEKGATELAVLDTFAGDPVKLAAVKEVSRVLNWKFNVMSKEEIVAKAPALFKSKPTKKDMKAVMAQSFVIDNLGVEAIVKGADGNIYTAAQLTEQLLDFAASPYDDSRRNIHIPSLPEGVVEEMRKSTQVPTKDDFKYAKGTETVQGVVVPSIRGWYGNQDDEKRGVGTPAHWQRARIEALKQLGYSDEEIIEDYVHDTEGGYRERLVSLDESHIDQLFGEPVEVYAPKKLF